MDKMIAAAKAVLSNYANFNGRANRGEYWWFVLIYTIVLVVLVLFEGLLLGGASLLSSIVELAVLVPSVAVGVRRLHDTGHTGWWSLLFLIPLVGVIILIFMSLARKGEEGANKFGEGPLHPEL